MLGYSNKAFNFGLLFPDNLRATEYKEQGEALTVSFQDPNTNEGFQVYVTPYNGKQIDTARFKLDEPSGVMKEPKDVFIGGTAATMFFSTNAVMGDTREVWFIRGGFLYEVTTYKELDTWLAQDYADVEIHLIRCGKVCPAFFLQRCALLPQKDFQS